MTRSVLFFEILPGRLEEFVERFRALEVLEHARLQAGFIRSELCVPADGSNRVMVTAEWESPEAYQGWLDNPIRPVLAAEIDPLLAASPEPLVYETIDDVRRREEGPDAGERR
jgi:quinol monooxygenase YgiN